jgi:vacuolar protein sorting-associated protein 26
MEVGIEDCLHIEFEFDRQKYHLKVCLIYIILFNILMSILSSSYYY